ncbi:PREDICTED: uncharacterized protein LOC109589940 [Amphimedon queenslandica]|uniref:Death domain-containing protein n=1 Tax=Amphimedon queenslandica TaxID=400682 RepID=A0A1X7T4J0_AMPQE|nr:PREDICTED: uncharacterized protein LOC109589940 [Amphimedon queenslandica]|eukprot:XP_019861474.1 PREDICTED: uncharacterized protein LOC109589940 [Amphimedon queenslandica]
MPTTQQPVAMGIHSTTPTNQDEATPKTQRILILYSNDPHVSSLPPDVRHTQDEYLKRVSDFVQTLQMFSTVSGTDGRSFSAYKCIYDVDESQREHIQNFNVWSFENLETCDTILLLMSPFIGDVLRGKSPVLEMEKGVADSHTLINVLPRKRVIPVYLNMPKVADWLPVFLKSTPSYFIDLLGFQSGMSTVTSEEEFGRRSYLLLDEDLNLKEMRDLLAVLRREPPPENPTTVFAVPPPKSSDLQSQGIPTKYLDLVTRMIPHIWDRVGLKLGFTLIEIQSIRSRNKDDPEQSIHSMFSKWQERDGAEATIDILIKVLQELRLNGVVYKLKAEVEKDKQKEKK